MDASAQRTTEQSTTEHALPSSGSGALELDLDGDLSSPSSPSPAIELAAIEARAAAPRTSMAPRAVTEAELDAELAAMLSEGDDHVPLEDDAGSDATELSGLGAGDVDVDLDEEAIDVSAFDGVEEALPDDVASVEDSTESMFDEDAEGGRTVSQPPPLRPSFPPAEGEGGFLGRLLQRKS